MVKGEQQPVNHVYGALFPEAELDLVRRLFGKARGVTLEEFLETYQLSIKDPLTKNVERHTMIVPERLVYLRVSGKRRRLADLWGSFRKEKSKSLILAESVMKPRKRRHLRATSAVPPIKA